MSIAGVLLAAGAGRRFVADDHKLVTPFRGRPLITWALDAATAAGALDEVIVVVGAVDLADLIPSDVSVVKNPDWLTGQASSLRRGVSTAQQHGHDAVVVGLGDSPLVSSEAWNMVARAPGDIVTATYGGRRRPPTKLAATIWDDLPVDGDEGARVLFEKWPDRVREVACEGDPGDIDTLEDLAPWN